MGSVSLEFAHSRTEATEHAHAHKVEVLLGPHHTVTVSAKETTALKLLA